MNDFFPGEGRKKITSLFSNDRRYNRSGSITTTAIDKEDAIRQYAPSNPGRGSWICLITKSRRWNAGWTSWSCSRRWKSKDCPSKSSHCEYDWSTPNGRSSIIRTTRCRFGNSPSAALSTRRREVNFRRKSHFSTWSLKTPRMVMSTTKTNASCLKMPSGIRRTTPSNSGRSSSFSRSRGSSLRREDCCWNPALNRRRNFIPNRCKALRSQRSSEKKNQINTNSTWTTYLKNTTKK